MNAASPHAQQTFTFTADYLQGTPVPSFKSVQPGEAYYYSKAVVMFLELLTCQGKMKTIISSWHTFTWKMMQKKVATMSPQ